MTGRKLVVSFPGGRGNETPLLYMSAKYFENEGFEKLFISHPTDGSDELEDILKNAVRVFERIDFREYEQVVFVAKSLGTTVACRLKEQFNIPAALVLYTPLEGTLPYINKSNDIILVAAGETDRFLDSGRLQILCERVKVPCYIEPGVGHRMEVKGNLSRDLEILAKVLDRLESEYIGKTERL